ncbi:protein of unknown function (DUF2341) [Thermoplasmatales archaeon SCGC AB-540-F20]|nr:protein of unknown function (DUF2341) [Thermoplasmatales archaeon SCGC AB-540-F20]
MKRNYLLKKSGVVGIIIIFICASFVSSIGGYSEDTSQVDIDIEDVCELKEDVLVTCSTFGFPGEPSQEITMSLNEAEFLYDKIKELQIEVARDPLSDKTQQLQHEIIILADEHNLLPASLSVETLKSRLTPTLRPQHHKLTLPRLQNRASEMFCNYVSTGSGTSLPIIILPRLIPILLTPIPRLFVRWSTMDGVTSCGGLRSGTGFIAYGAQNGIALGFWGIGFSIFLPPVMAYGLFGYALFASVNAEEIELWPPNYPPEITVVSPLNGAENVPISTSELSFHISDFNEDLMSYSVTTTPDIGSGSGNNKPDGTYSVPISGLEGSEEYTWQVEVSDGVNNVATAFTFTTEPVAPIVSNPSPDDGAYLVPVDTMNLYFNIHDPQGDLMDYTVETIPNIGSGSSFDVSGGTYSISISGLDYLTDYNWYVNVTDGANWKHKIFSFQTEPIMVFNPFDEGWLYRKTITINHTNVAGDLENFPILISTMDTDLRDKAQPDGDDILFMNGPNVATRLYHEIEFYDDANGELIAWVNVADLDSNQDTELYLYYGNPGCTSQQLQFAAWDSDFLTVLHMKDDPDPSHVRDSTAYQNDGTKKGGNEPLQTTGVIGNGQYFDGVDDYIDTKDFDINDDFTMSLWIDLTSIQKPKQFFIGKHKSEKGDENIVLFGINSEDNYYCRIRNEFHMQDTVETGQQYLVAVGKKMSSSETQITYYKDGLMLWQQSISEVVGNALGRPWTIGQDWDGNERTDFVHGTMDEIRISNAIRDGNWISTEYTNQNEPNSFYTIGPEETGP